MTSSSNIADSSIAYPLGCERNWSHPASNGEMPRPLESGALTNTALPDEVMQPIRLTRTPSIRVSAGAATARRRQNNSS